MGNETRAKQIGKPVIPIIYQLHFFSNDMAPVGKR